MGNGDHDFYNISLIPFPNPSLPQSCSFIFRFSPPFFVPFFSLSADIIHSYISTSHFFFLSFSCVTRPPNLRVPLSVLAEERSFQRGISTVPRPDIPKYVTYTSPSSWKWLACFESEVNGAVKVSTVFAVYIYEWKYIYRVLSRDRLSKITLTHFVSWF